MNISIKSQFIALIALLSASQLSSSSPIENEAILALAARVDGLQSKVDQLVIQLNEEKILRQNFQSLNEESEKKIHQLAVENDNKNEEFKAKIDLIIDQNIQQEEEIRQLKNIIRKDALTSKLNSINDDEEHRPTNKDEAGDDLLSNGSSSRLPPSSCRQLSTIGHYLDGIYLVANPETNKIETVYCDFGSSTQIFYGSVDVKTKSVHFFVQRATSNNFATVNAVIPFDTELLNEGDAMDLASGVFTVPVNGIYHFEFKGVKYPDTAELFIYLQVNGVNIGTALATRLPNTLGLSGIGASLRLKTGDKVRLFKASGTLHDDSASVNYRYTHFTGWLVEEDLVLSA